MKISRRSWLQGFGTIAGAALGTRFIGSEGVARADAKKSAVVSIFFEGGFNAVFSSADTFAGSGAFGASSSNVKNVGNGLVVDAKSIGTLGDWALGHMAAIGNDHGSSAHPAAQLTNFTDGTQSYLVQLASAIGGEASFKACALADLPPGPAPAVNGTSLQLLRSMEDVAHALGIGAVDPKDPARIATSKALARARQMSLPALNANPKSLGFAKDAYDTDIDSLSKPPIQVDLASIAQVYSTSSSGTLDLVPAKLAAAELLLRGGTNVISLQDHGWDSHGDRTGTTVRSKMAQSMLPALKTFIGRLRSEPALAAIDVTVILHGDFARNLPGSDHADCLSALVIGPNVKVGTTGKVSSSVHLPASTGASREMWSYLAAVSKVAQNPFGNNPHALVA